MTHSIHHNLLVFHYSEAVEKRHSVIVYNTLLNHYETSKDKVIKSVFISLKHSANVSHNHFLDHLVKQMDKLSQKISLPVVLGDYKKETILHLKSLSASTQIKLYQNFNTAVLFLNPHFFKKSLNVLLFDEDPTNADKLVAELLKLGYSITHAKSIEDLKTQATLKTYDMTITQNCFNQTKSSFTLQPNLSLSKELIINLPVFIDTAVDSLVTITGLEAQKITHAIKSFEQQFDTNVIIASMKFKGDLSGHFFLVFPRSVAAIALEAMVGECVDANDSAAILDGVAELCNIITGSAKVIFSSKKLKVLFELPKTYLSLQLALNETSNENGIWIEMQLNKKPFYMFITK